MEKGDRVKTTIYLDRQELLDLKFVCLTRGERVSSVIRKLISKHLKGKGLGK